MRIRDLIEASPVTKLPGLKQAEIRTRRRPPTDQEEMDAGANEHRVEIAPPEAPPDAAFKEIHGTPWIPPAYE